MWRKKRESNFRVFYLLVQGAKESIRDALSLEKDVNQYRMLRRGGCLDGSQAQDEFEQLSMSMILMGFPSKVQVLIWSVLAAILHLGNGKLRTTGLPTSADSHPQPTPQSNLATLLNTKTRYCMTTKQRRDGH